MIFPRSTVEAGEDRVADTYVYGARRSAKMKVTKAAARRATTARTGAAVPRPIATT